MKMTDWSPQVEGVVESTGVVPEFIASALEIPLSELTEEVFLEEVRRHPEWHMSPEQIAAHKAYHAKFLDELNVMRPEFEAKQKRRAMLAWRAVVDRVNETGDQSLDEDPICGFDALIHKYLDECSIGEFIALAAQNAQRAQAIAKANARHAEHRAMRAEVEAWYKENGDKYPSINAAAEAAAGTLVPVKFGTVRDWISDYKNRILSASKP